MSHLPEDTNPHNWHRYFAMENNNRAWELAALPSRSESEQSDMLNAAHAAAAHWGVVGSELNDMRAKMLLAEVHALLGFEQSALALSEQVRSYFLTRTTDDWEIAFVHAIHAHAAAVAGDADQHLESYEAAVAAIAALTDEQDRDIVMQTFNQVPTPEGWRGAS